MSARVFITMISSWLLVSGFAWPHSRMELLNVIVVGVLAPVLAWVSASKEWARYGSAAAGVWLILTTLRFGTQQSFTVVHNLMVGASIFVASLIAHGASELQREHQRREEQVYGRV